MRKFLLPVLALLVGAAVGYGLKSGASAPESAPAPRAKALRGGAIPEAGERETVKMLRRRVAELESRLAQQDGAAAPSAAPSADAVREPSREGPRGFADFREQMRKWEKEDPKRYAQFTNGMARMRARRLERTQGRLAYLASLDVSSLDADAQKVHARLQKAIVARDAVLERMQDPELSDAERGKLMKDMHESSRELRALSQAERQNLLRLTADSIGLSGDDAQALVDTVADVVEATESGGGMPPPGPPPGAASGPPPGPPPEG